MVFLESSSRFSKYLNAVPKTFLWATRWYYPLYMPLVPVLRKSVPKVFFWHFFSYFDDNFLSINICCGQWGSYMVSYTWSNCWCKKNKKKIDSWRKKICTIFFNFHSKFSTVTPYKFENQCSAYCPNKWPIITLWPCYGECFGTFGSRGSNVGAEKKFVWE